jgi:hypothetical protein
MGEAMRRKHGTGPESRLGTRADLEVRAAHDCTRALRATLARADIPGPTLAHQADLDALGPDTARMLRELIDNLERIASKARRLGLR